MADDKATARKKLELVKNEEQRTTSGVVPAGSNTGGIATGAVIDGKYRVGAIVGSGAVGIVFEAQNLELDEKVAIKCLRPEMLADKAMVARFGREAKAAAAIKSEYVSSVYDVGTTRDGIPYIVMEYLEGKDLGTVVQDNGTLAPRVAVEYALQVCEALAIAHSKGIVHRDIKPENLLLTERSGGIRIVKVLDFGISKAALTGSIFRDEVPLVKTVNLMGTPLYMSPEQVRCSDGVDVRSDIWSLGMVIYEILTGHTAFIGTSITEICAAILEHTPQPMATHRNDVPPGLVAIIERCLEKDAAKRFQNVAELAMALMPFGPKRSRLNVERAVAVLQASGHVDPKLEVNSVPPGPGSSDSMLLTPLPLAPRTPSDPIFVSGIQSAGGVSSLPVPPASTPSGAPLAETSSAVPSFVPPKKSKAPLLIGLVLIAGAIGGAAVFLKSRTEPARTPIVAATANPVTTAAPPAPTAVETAKPAASPAPIETQAPAAKTTAAPFVPAKTGFAKAAPPPVVKASTNTSTSSKTTATPSSTKPKSEEPDLGY